MKCIVLLVALFLSNAVSAQDFKENVKFGKPTDEEMKMTQVDFAPDAEAAILCDLRTEYFSVLNADFQKIIEYKRRIKVLKSEGTSYANVSVVYTFDKNHPDGIRESVKGISATAFNLEGGKVVATKMKSNLIFRERVDDETMLLKFTIPQVKVGTVIEYEFDVNTNNVYSIDTWYAQGDIPVMYTRYDVTIPEYFHFSVESTGPNPVEATQKEGTENFYISADANLVANTTTYTFISHNLPPLKDDHSLWCVNDYRNKVSFDLSYVQYTGFFKSFTETWGDAAKLLMENSQFGECLSKTPPLREELAKLDLAMIDSVDDKVVAIYKLLMSHVKWNGEYELSSSKRANAVLKDGTGSSSDLNFMLINMLNASGIEAHPLCVRLRSHGRLPMTHASISKLSTFVVAFKRSGTDWGIIDATSKEGYVDVLNPDLMAIQCLLVKPDSYNWIDISQRCASREITRIEGEIKTDGSITGHRKLQNIGQASWAFKVLAEKNDTVDVNERLSNELSATIANETVSPAVSEFTPEIDEDLDFVKTGQSGDGIIYVNPFVFRIWEDNPFKNETRAVPIERPWTTSEDFVSTLTIPKGYDLEEMPKDLSLKTPGNEITCKVIFRKDGNKLITIYRYSVRTLIFDAEAYQDLRKIYEMIVNKCNEMVAIKKL